MAVVWQSTGFWLMVCAVLFVIVAGCTMLSQRLTTINQSSTADPHTRSTVTPMVTLGLIEPLYIDTPTARFQHDTFHDRSTAPPLRDDPYLNYTTPNGTVSHTEPILFRIDSPQCYSLANGEYSCLGLFWNESARSLGDTRLQFIFSDDNNQRLGQVSTILSQRLIPAGSRAPYRVQIPPAFANALTNGQVDIAVDYSRPPALDRISLTVSDARGTLTDDGRYRLTVSVYNDSDQAVHDVRLFITLNSIEWGIVGYSVQEVGEQFSAGERKLLQFEVIPQALPAEIEHHLHVEARIIAE